jgi:excisionase family DNA binding protein
MADQLLKMPRVAELLGVTLPRAYALARQGVLPSVRLGRQRRVAWSQLNRFIGNGGKGLSPSNSDQQQSRTA